MKPIKYVIDYNDATKKWEVRWMFYTNGDVCFCRREYKRKPNAMIYLARLKDDQFSMQQQFRWIYKRHKKEEASKK